jgi:hypothetical protein
MGRHSRWGSRGRRGPASETTQELANLRNSKPYAAGELVLEGAELAFEQMSAVTMDNHMGISRRTLAHIHQRAIERLPDRVTEFWEPSGQLAMKYDGMVRALDQVRAAEPSESSAGTVALQATIRYN